MNEGLRVIDDTGTVIYVNAALCRMVGSSEDELVGKSAADIMQGPDLDAVFDKIADLLPSVPIHPPFLIEAIYRIS